MPFPTIPAREAVFPHEVVMKVGSTVLGQVQAVDPDENINTVSERRLSDPQALITKTTKEGTVAINLYDQDSMKELALLLGGATLPGGGWAGTEQIKLSSDTPKQDITLEYYDSIAAGNLQKILTLEGFQVVGFRKGITAGDGSIVNVLRGTTDDQYFTPTAGVGST